MTLFVLLNFPLTTTVLITLWNRQTCHSNHETANVTTDETVTPVPLDELFDYDDISVPSVQDNELDPPTSTSDPAQLQPEDMDFVQSTEPQN